MTTKTLHVQGMHCNACKLLLEKSLSTIGGIHAVHANVTQGTVTLDYDQDPNFDAINQTIKDCGYQLSETKIARPRLSKNIYDYKVMIVSLLGFVFLYLLLSKTGVLSFNLTNSTPSLGLVALIGLTAGFSTCMAIVGGLVMAISAKQNEKHQDLSFAQKIIPHLWFNTGRIV